MSAPTSRTWRVVIWQRVMTVVDVEATSRREAKSVAFESYAPPRIAFRDTDYLGSKGIHGVWQLESATVEGGVS